MAAPNATRKHRCGRPGSRRLVYREHVARTDQDRRRGQQRQHAVDHHDAERQPGECLALIPVRDEQQRESAQQGDGCELPRPVVAKRDQRADDAGGAGGADQRPLEGERRNASPRRTPPPGRRRPTRLRTARPPVCRRCATCRGRSGPAAIAHPPRRAPPGRARDRRRRAASSIAGPVDRRRRAGCRCDRLRCAVPRAPRMRACKRKCRLRSIRDDRDEASPMLIRVRTSPVPPGWQAAAWPRREWLECGGQDLGATR